MRLAVWILAFAITVPAVAQYRPPGRDLSLKWTNETYLVAYCGLGGYDVHTCSQYERDLKEMTLIDRAELLLDAVGDLCPYETHTAWTSSFLNGLYPKLLLPYECRSGLVNSAGVGTCCYTISASGDHYSKPRNTAQLFRACVTSATKKIGSQLVRPLARLRLGGLMNADLRDLLDVNETLDGPAPFKLGPDKPDGSPWTPPKIDPVRAASAPLDGRISTRQRDLVNRPEDLARLEATGHEHEATLCGSHETTTIGVQLAHVQYEALCNGDETCLHFRTMPTFHGGCDRRWTATECCQWKAIEHAFHTRWRECQRRGDGFCSRNAGWDHKEAHLSANRGGYTVAGTGPIVIFSCPEYPHDVLPCVGPGGVRGPNTPRAFLPFLVAKLGLS